MPYIPQIFQDKYINKTNAEVSQKVKCLSFENVCEES